MSSAGRNRFARVAWSRREGRGGREANKEMARGREEKKKIADDEI